jgi:Amidohydrolase
MKDQVAMKPVRPPNPNTRPPKLKAPPGACDTHLHIYGPFDRYPLSAARHYTPAEHSTLEDYLRVHRTLGLERAVIVTGSGNGTNNRVTADAIAHMKGQFKGLALLDPAITDVELAQLKESGFTGFRMKANGKDALSIESAPLCVHPCKIKRSALPQSRTIIPRCPYAFANSNIDTPFARHAHRPLAWRPNAKLCRVGRADLV